MLHVDALSRNISVLSTLVVGTEYWFLRIQLQHTLATTCKKINFNDSDQKIKNNYIIKDQAL